MLGVNIDEKLTFSEHGKDINKRASQKVGVLLRLHNLIPCSAKVNGTIKVENSKKVESNCWPSY